MSTSPTAAAIRPDRPSFERNVRTVNERLQSLHLEREEILGDGGVLAACQALLDDSRQQRRQHRSEWMQRQPTFQAIKRAHEAMKPSVNSLLTDSDIVYRDEQKLTAKLRHLSDVHRSHNFANAREENVFVKEIDKLVRNQRKLPVYMQTLRECKERETTIKDAQHEINQMKRDERRCYMQCGRLTKERNTILSHLDEVRRQHIACVREKSALIKDYDSQKDAFVEFARTSDKQSPPKRMRVSTDSDDELEPFHELRNNCRWAIRYLRQLQQMTTEKSASDQKPTAPQPTPVPVRTYARVLRGSLSDDSPSEDAGSRPKRTSKRGKRPTHAITHPVDAYNAFAVLQLTAPDTFGDIAPMLEKVEDKLKDIDEWTKRPTEMTHADWESMYTAPPASVTSDSASMSFSDASFSSSITSPHSPGGMSASNRLSSTCSLPTVTTPPSSLAFGRPRAVDTMDVRVCESMLKRMTCSANNQDSDVSVAPVVQLPSEEDIRSPRTSSDESFQKPMADDEDGKPVVMRV